MYTPDDSPPGMYGLGFDPETDGVPLLLVVLTTKTTTSIPMPFMGELSIDTQMEMVAALSSALRYAADKYEADAAVMRETRRILDDAGD